MQPSAVMLESLCPFAVYTVLVPLALFAAEILLRNRAVLLVVIVASEFNFLGPTQGPTDSRTMRMGVINARYRHSGR